MSTNYYRHDARSAMERESDALDKLRRTPVPAAAIRFREALSVADMPDRTREELLDLFQEALDEAAEIS